MVTFLIQSVKPYWLFLYNIVFVPMNKKISVNVFFLFFLIFLSCSVTFVVIYLTSDLLDFSYDLPKELPKELPPAPKEQVKTIQILEKPKTSLLLKETIFKENVLKEPFNNCKDLYYNPKDAFKPQYMQCDQYWEYLKKVYGEK
jgi:hypothetical protein